jgi:hypothetical protein
MSSLAAINTVLEKQSADISTMKDRIVEMLNMQKQSRLDELEAQREASKAQRSFEPKSSSSSKTGGSNFLPALALPSLGSLALPAIAALAAELTNLDDFLKGLRIVDLIPSFTKFLDNLVNLPSTLTKLFDDTIVKLKDLFKNIKLPKIELPKLPKISFIMPEGWGLIRLPKLPIMEFIDDAGKKIVDFADYKIRLPSMELIDKLNKAIDSTGITRVFNAITDVIGTGTGIVADIASAGGKGLLGFFSIVGSGFQKLKDIPFLGAGIKLLVRPFTQFLISAFDFVTGFVDGFNSVPNIVNPETGEITVDLKAKLIAGVDSGIKNVIDGIVKGIELVFFKIPGWILEKLGVPNPLDDINLTQFTDPIWNGIKGTFKFVFDSEYRTQQLQAFKEKYDILGMVERFFSGMFESVRGFFGFGENEAIDRSREVATKYSNAQINAINEQIADLESQGFTAKNNSAVFEDRELFRLQKQLETLKASLEQNSKYQGTKGFENFGAGTPAMLHGSEAVVPENSAAGNILKSANTTRVSEALSSIATGRSAAAPNIYIDNTNNSSSIVNKGGDSPMYFGNSSAIDHRYERKHLGMLGFGSAVGNVF